MLDFSFSELLLCFIVALVVLGPERLPGIARGLGRWTGQARSYVRNLTAELERESQVAEFKKQVSDAHRILREESTSFHDSVKGTVDSLDAQGRSSAVTEALAAPVVSPTADPAAPQATAPIKSEVPKPTP